jgi:hypothetical protein
MEKLIIKGVMHYCNFNKSFWRCCEAATFLCDSAPCASFFVALAAPAPSPLYTKPTFLKQTKVNLRFEEIFSEFFFYLNCSKSEWGNVRNYYRL